MKAKNLNTDFEPVVIKMSDVTPVEVQWLWKGRIPLGRLSLLVGRPGVGKSFLTCQMAANVSTGSDWHDGTPCPSGSVMLLSAEDDPADTIRPRLDTHGADASKVLLLKGKLSQHSNGEKVERTITLGDLGIIEQSLEDCRDCKLVIVDPIGSYLGAGTDSHRDNEVRAVLAPLAALAEKMEVAVLLVAHTRKAQSNFADDTALGSRAFTGIARSVWHIFKDPDNPARRLFLPGKNNLTASPKGLAFTIEPESARLQWLGEVDTTADEVVTKASKTSHASPEKENAKEWLINFLKNEGPSSPSVIYKRAEEDGIAKGTLDRAKKSANIKIGPDGYQGKWSWSLEGD
jgi:putative DNA primase/helicase